MNHLIDPTAEKALLESIATLRDALLPKLMRGEVKVKGMEM